MVVVVVVAIAVLVVVVVVVVAPAATELFVVVVVVLSLIVTEKGLSVSYSSPSFVLDADFRASYWRILNHWTHGGSIVVLILLRPIELIRTVLWFFSHSIGRLLACRLIWRSGG